MLPSFYTGNKFDDVVAGLRQYYFFIPHILLLILFTFFNVSTSHASTLFEQSYWNSQYKISPTKHFEQTIDCADVNGTIESVSIIGATSGSFTPLTEYAFYIASSSIATGTLPSYSIYGYATTTAYFDVPYECISGEVTLSLWRVGGFEEGYVRVSTVDVYDGGICTHQDNNCADLTFSLYGEVSTVDEGGTMECDMASTTEAIYAVGYSINLYLGIFLALIFGVIALRFFSQFIK